MQLRFFAIAGLILLLSEATASADATPALPFWSKPFPTGYADTGRTCLVRRRHRTAHGVRTELVDTCRPAISVHD